MIDFDDPVNIITDNQAKVLRFLIERKARIAKKPEISEMTGVPLGTVKDAIYALEKYNFIFNRERYHKGRMQGFSYEINETLCKKFMETRAKELAEIESSSQPAPSDNTRNQTPNMKHIDHVLASDSELTYWRDKGLTAMQIESWMAETNISLDIMLRYLRYFRYDLVENGREGKIKNSFNYFYSVIKNNGGFEKPSGYQSSEQKKADAIRKETEELTQELEILKAAQEERQKAQFEVDFYKAIQDPESDIYKKLLSYLTPHQKSTINRGNGNGTAYLRSAYLKMLEKEGAIE